MRGEKRYRLSTEKPEMETTGKTTVVQEIVCYGVDWIDLAQDMEKWRAFVNTLMNLCFP
jgi:hypothetical protein